MIVSLAGCQIRGFFLKCGFFLHFLLLMIQQGNDDIYFCFGANKPIKSPATPQLDDFRFWADKQVCKPILDVEFLHYLCRGPDYEALTYLSSIGVNREKCLNCAWRCLCVFFFFYFMANHEHGGGIACCLCSTLQMTVLIPLCPSPIVTITSM